MVVRAQQQHHMKNGKRKLNTAQAEEKNPQLKKQKRNLEKRQQKSSSSVIEAVVAAYESLKERNPSSFKKFKDFPLSEPTQRGLDESSYFVPTQIQQQSLSHSLLGADVIGAAKTGSGKTLAFVIPLLENLWRNRWCRDDGLGAIIISPTRELALQTFNTINKIGRFHDFSCCLMIGGGTDVAFEKLRISRMNIIVCTPGRLLQHLDENENFFMDQLQMLVIDEADRILDLGFSSQMKSIIQALPTKRQVLLFSATVTCDVNELSRICAKDPTFVSVHETANHATPDELEQMYLICEEEEKLNLLWSFITMHRKAKTLIFVSTCKQARFIYEAFHELNPSVIFLGLWGTMKQTKRIAVFEKFETNRHVCMVATDVASRGLDFKNIDWVVQMDPPPEVDDYIHRVGRTARMGNFGHSLLFLTSRQEKETLHLFRQRKIPIMKMEIDPKSTRNIQRKLQSILAEIPELNAFAQRAFVSYIRSVYVMKNKNIFNIEHIRTKELAESFGLVSVPRIRFLRKQGAHMKKVKDNQQDEVILGKDFGEEVLDLSEDELFVKKDLNLCKNEDAGRNQTKEQKTEIMTETTRKKSRLLTREVIAQNIVNKKIKINKRIVFDDDDSNNKGSSVAQSLGLDLEKAKMEKIANDQMDKKLYRNRLKEIKRQRKLNMTENKSKLNKDQIDLGASDDESDRGPDLDWLPQPAGWNSDEEDDLPNEYNPELDGILEKLGRNGKKKPPQKTKANIEKKRITNTDDAEKEALNFLDPF